MGGGQLIPKVESGISGVIKISCSGISFLVLTSYGIPYIWGQVGTDPENDTPIIIENPVPVGDLTEIVDISDGVSFHFIKRDGTVWGMGQNTFGELGDGTTTARMSAPVQVLFSFSPTPTAAYVLAADFDSDGRADPIAMDNSGNWCVWYSHQSYTRDGPYSLGISGQPVAGDVDGDGQGDMGIVQNGQWYIWLSGQSNALSGPYAFGVDGTPVLADFDGDGKADPAMVSASGGWHVFLSGSGYSQVSANFGVSGGTPVAGDFDGDGKADPVMVDGNGNWYFWLSGSMYNQHGPYNFGVAGKPVAGDFDGDGKADPAMMDAFGNWYIWPSSSFYIPDGPYYLVLP